MKLTARYRDKTSWNHAGLIFVDEEGRSVAHVLPKGAGYTQLTEAETEVLVQSLLAALEGAKLEIPDRESGYATPAPAWLSESGSSGGRGAVPRSSALPPEDQIPRNADGEVIVPPRSKTETPAQKRLRRALRSLRNRERAEKEGAK